jgi:hypothetical protein
MWMFVGLLGALVLIILVALLQSARRRRALERLTREKGWSFEAGDAPEFSVSYEDAYGLYQVGRSRMASDIVRGTLAGRPFEVFGYRYVVGSLKHPVVHHQTVVHFDDPNLRLPWFSLRPAETARQLFGTQGFGNVFLDAAPEFSMRNYVAGQDPTATARRFSDPVIGAFGAQQGVAVDAGGAHLFVFRPRRIEKVANLTAVIQGAADIADAFAASAPPAPPPLDLPPL